MAYSKSNIKTENSNEQVVILDSVDYVAVSCSLERSGSFVVFNTTARVVDNDGNTIFDSSNNEMTSAFKHSVPASVIDSTSSNILSRDCLMAILGEATDTAWDPIFLGNVSIRSVISASKIVGPIDIGDAL